MTQPGTSTLPATRNQSESTAFMLEFERVSLSPSSTAVDLQTLKTQQQHDPASMAAGLRQVDLSGGYFGTGGQQVDHDCSDLDLLELLESMQDEQ